MLETIKKQFESGRTLTQSKYYNNVDRGQWPKFYWDLYPLAQEYYHELNPYFLFNFYRPDFYKFSKVITVRDGFLNFASFMIDNVSSFKKLEAGIFLIHPDLAPIVPKTVSDQFACWNIVQRKQLKINDAKKVIVFGFACDQYLGDLDSLYLKLQELKNISPDASVELYFPIRKNVFSQDERETVMIHHLMNQIKDTLPGRKLKILTGDHFFENTNFKDTFIFDLAHDKFMVSDNYLHYYVQSRGASVNNNSLTSAPKDSMFSLDLSIHHELHVTPLPKEHNIFADLILFKKTNPSSKNILYNSIFQNLLRDGLKK
jgi:hypothetical protein